MRFRSDIKPFRGRGHLIKVDTPKIGSFWVIAQDALKHRPSSLNRSNFELKKGSLADDFDVFTTWEAEK
jgi:hypothetical protein